MSKVPRQLKYTNDHEWIRVEGDVAVIGITDHAQQALGDLTYVDLPEVGTRIEQADPLMAVESTKAASDVFAPVGATVSEVNELLTDHPELVNQDPYGVGWLCKLSGFDAGELDRLMDAAAYTAFQEEDSR